MSIPGVSMICPTFGRPPALLHLLEETVECFLRQDWPAKELLILNDNPRQTLTCEAPGVRIINWPKRIATLGGKYNSLVSDAKYDILAPAEDDDLSLPWRLTQAVRALGDGFGYWNPQRTWFWDSHGLHWQHTHGYCHNASAFTRAAWAQVGGYPAISGSQDAAMDGLLKQRVAVAPGLADDPSAWSYIYRWSVSDFHLSAYPDTEKAYRDHAAAGAEGTYTIRPHWRQDYLVATRQALATMRMQK
jgi:glycosyltransferase involved in cell wall biosynthesis